jgi:hypothetical protein
MGWYEYLVRKHLPVYLSDQVSRAPSGFDATPFNLVREGDLPLECQPEILQASHQFAWKVFRIGPFGHPTSRTSIPRQRVDELYKQMIPDLNDELPEKNTTWEPLADLEPN